MSNLGVLVKGRVAIASPCGFQFDVWCHSLFEQLLMTVSLQVLCRGKSAVDLSGDHRPYGKAPSAVAELKRLKEAGCWVRGCPTSCLSRVAFRGGPLGSFAGLP